MKKTAVIVIAVILAAAAMISCGPQQNRLSAHEWTLSSAVNADSTSALTVPRGVTIHFSDSTMVFGRGGCNGFFGPYETKGNTVKIGQLGSTMMWCMNMAFESAYFKMLEKIDRFEVTEKELKLMDAEGKITLTYVPSSEVAATDELPEAPEAAGILDGADAPTPDVETKE